MDILNKAMELGQMIADSEELSRLKLSEQMLDTDEQARKLMNEYKQLQIELVRATKAKGVASEVEKIKGQLIEKQRQINEYGITNEYLEAKNGFDRLMQNINNVITFAITGEEQCSSGSCGSCSGCS